MVRDASCISMSSDISKLAPKTGKDDYQSLGG
jgi:hypothetical protein